MKVIGMDGRTHTWKLRPNGLKSRPRSSYHLRARALLERLYCFEQRLEEAVIPGSNGMALDFFLPAQKLAIEVQGEQHFEFSGHFHGDRTGFAKSQERDTRKRDWAASNGFEFVELPFNESDAEWTKRILGNFRTDSFD